MSYERIFNALQGRGVKPRRDEWTACDEEGWSIAHYWVTHNKVTNEFEYWTLADSSGWTVAHAAASMGNLPKGFTHWKLKDINGDSVAHIAIRHGQDLGYSTKCFTKDIFKLMNNKGVSVQDEINARDAVKFQQLKAIVKK